jgi:hypothetical protein
LPRITALLIPNEIDWSVPPEAENIVKGDTELLCVSFPDRGEWNALDPKWRKKIFVDLNDARVGSLKETKLLTHKLVGHEREGILQKTLRDAGETDLIHVTPSFGKI